MSRSQNNRTEERLFPRAAIAAAVTIGSAVLVRRVHSLPVRILTPLATAAVATYFLLPDHAHFHNNSSRVPLTARAKEHADAAAVASANEPITTTSTTTTTTKTSGFKPRSIVVDKNLASTAIKQHDAIINRGAVMGKNTEERARKVHENIVDAGLPVSRQGKNELHTIDISRKAYEQPGKLVATELEHTPERDASRVAIKVKNAATKAKEDISKGVNNAATKAKDDISKGVNDAASKVKKGVHEAASKVKEEVHEATAKVEKGATKPAGTSTPTITTTTTTTKTSEFKPRSIVVDKNIASAAIKQHDAIINRGAVMGKNTEERARKVHESIVDAALPASRQGKNELHTIDISRKAYEQPGKLVATELEHTPERDASRVAIKVKKATTKAKEDIRKGVNEIADKAGKIVDHEIPVEERNSSRRERGDLDDSSDDENNESHERQKLKTEEKNTKHRRHDQPGGFSLGTMHDKDQVAEKLQSSFGYFKDEKLVGEYSCWLARSVLLPGYLYLTTNHVCFYANLPSNHEVYYPIKTIDLKEALSAEPSPKNELAFYIYTESRRYKFRTDSELGRTDWVKAIQKSIFHAKTDEDNVKISIPFDNIAAIDMSASTFAETIRLSVFETSDSLDEYYFAYFDNTRGALNDIQSQFRKYKETDTHVPADKLRFFNSTSPSADSPRKSLAAEPPQGPLAASLLESRVETVQSTTSAVSKLNSLKYIRTTDMVSSLRTDSSSTRLGPGSGLDGRSHDGNSAKSPLSFSIRGTATWIADHAPGFGFKKEEMLVDEEQETFRKEFSLPEGEGLSVIVSGYLLRVLPLYGKVYISDNYICFKSTMYGTSTKLILPLLEVEKVNKHHGTRFYFHGLSLLTTTTRTNEEIFLEFSSKFTRDSILSSLHNRITPEAQKRRKQYRKAVQAATTTETPSLELDDPMESRVMDSLQLREGQVGNGEPMSLAAHPGFKPSRPLHITCLTIGSRGDVQPYIALCKRLKEDGHTCRIATHGEYKDWVEGHGIEFGYVGGDPGELIELCVENGMFTVSFIREGLKKFRSWLDDLMKTAWEACQNTDVLIESPSAMAGIHIAEKLEIPYFRAFPFPWTRTRAFSHPFAVPERNLGRGYNYMTHTTIEQVFWKGISGQVNRWRQHKLGLPPTTLERMEAHRVPTLYSWSPNVVPAPMDWHSWVHVTGYWFLDNPDHSWTPPEGLEAFLEADSSHKPIYIGFGSMVVSDPEEMTRTIVEAVVESGVRAVISKGWSDKSDNSKDDLKKKKKDSYPKSIFMLESVPHDWLFPRLSGVVHHGGAGTTAAGLRAGLPTVIKPYFGDQYFWAQRVEDGGVGVWCRDLTVKKLASALSTITTDEKMIKKARLIGERIRSEDGVGAAIQYFYHDLPLAKERLEDRRKRKGKVSAPLNIRTDRGVLGQDRASSEMNSCAKSPTSSKLKHSATFTKSESCEIEDVISPRSDKLKPSSTDPGVDRLEEKAKERNEERSPEELAADLEIMQPPHPHQSIHLAHIREQEQRTEGGSGGNVEHYCDISEDDYEDADRSGNENSKARKAIKSMREKMKHVKDKIKYTAGGGDSVTKNSVAG
ncbi:Sterol 3-beta-glucosyltransferase [Gryganskiella cystojenkinii]|nr:Sterol 3-beta-glucosyltransferase [Gryganskiella cystojenkinii]